VNAILRLVGIVCMIAGVGLEVLGFAGAPSTRSAHARERASAAPAGRAAQTVGPYAPSLSTGFYAQNAFFHATASLDAQTTLRYTVVTRFTERVTIGFDRPVTTCLTDQGERSRVLRVFPIAGIPGYRAVTFFTTAERLANAGSSVVCTLAQPVSSARTDGDALAPLDPIVAHHRLEYAAHANLAGLPRALYPPRDPAMRRFPVRSGGHAP